MNGNSLYTKKDEILAIPISTEQKEELRQFSKEKKISMSQAARLILADFLDSNLLKTQVNSKGKGG